MKRSKSLQLVVMASTAATLAGCSDGPQSDGYMYTSERNCVARKEFTNPECKRIFSAGWKTHEKSGPQYTNISLCREQHGTSGCYKIKDSNFSRYTPSPSGYFVGLTPQNLSLEDRTRPIYSDKKRRNYYSPGGFYVYSGKGNTWRTSEKAITTKPRPAKVQTRTTIASRKGFGGRSSRFRSGG